MLLSRCSVVDMRRFVLNVVFPLLFPKLISEGLWGREALYEEVLMGSCDCRCNIDVV